MKISLLTGLQWDNPLWDLSCFSQCSWNWNSCISHYHVEKVDFISGVQLKFPQLFFNIDDSLPECFCHEVEKVVMNVFKVEITFLPPWIILSACKETKLSYHIDPTVLFSSMKDMKDFINIALRTFANCFDNKIYTNYRLFRTFKSTKLGQNRPFIFHSDTFISSTSNAGLKDNDIFLLSLISYPQCSFPFLTFRSSSYSTIPRSIPHSSISLFQKDFNPIYYHSGTRPSQSIILPGTRPTQPTILPSTKTSHSKQSKKECIPSIVAQ